MLVRLRGLDLVLIVLVLDRKLRFTQKLTRDSVVVVISKEIPFTVACI